MSTTTRVPCSYPECGGGCAGCQPEPQQTPRPSWVDGGATLHRTEGEAGNAPDRGNDLLDMTYINSLPQPFMGRELGGWWWPIHDFEVETGLLRIDVCGLLQVKHIGDFTAFRDDAGVERSAEAFYSDAIPEERIAIAPNQGEAS